MDKVLSTLLTLIFFSNYSSAQKNILGYYISNYAESGWFVYEILLQDDFNFKYRFSGDLFYDVTEGKYEIKKDTVLFQFVEFKPDSFLIINNNDSTWFLDTRRNHAEHLRPQKMFFSKNKLFRIDGKGNIIKVKTFAYSRNLFGIGYYKKKMFYLRKIKRDWKA